MWDSMVPGLEGAGNQGLCLLSKLENNECIDYRVLNTLDYCSSGAEGEVNHTPQRADFITKPGIHHFPLPLIPIPILPPSNTYSIAFNMVFLCVFIVVKYNVKLTILTIFKCTLLWHQAG